jgi:hypothetical protein
MTRDPIVEEVRAVRDSIAKEHDYDVAAIFAALRAMGKGETRVALAPRRTAPVAETPAQLGAAADGASPRS